MSTNTAIIMVVSSVNAVPPPVYEHSEPGAQVILLLTDPDIPVPPLLKSKPHGTGTVRVEQADWDAVISNSSNLPGMQFRSKAWEVLDKATDLEISYVWDFDENFRHAWTPLQSFFPPTATELS